jgi:hypothetical protein
MLIPAGWRKMTREPMALHWPKCHGGGGGEKDGDKMLICNLN